MVRFAEGVLLLFLIVCLFVCLLGGASGVEECCYHSAASYCLLLPLTACYCLSVKTKHVYVGGKSVLSPRNAVKGISVMHF